MQTTQIRLTFISRTANNQSTIENIYTGAIADVITALRHNIEIIPDAYKTGSNYVVCGVALAWLAQDYRQRGPLSQRNYLYDNLMNIIDDALGPDHRHEIQLERYYNPSLTRDYCMAA